MISALLILYFAVGLYMGFYADDTSYFICEQFQAFILLGIIIVLLPKTTARAIAMGIFLMVFFEMVDELAGRNLRHYFNDYISILLAIAVTVHLSLKWNRLKKN